MPSTNSEPRWIDSMERLRVGEVELVQVESIHSLDQLLYLHRAPVLVNHCLQNLPLLAAPPPASSSLADRFARYPLTRHGFQA